MKFDFRVFILLKIILEPMFLSLHLAGLHHTYPFAFVSMLNCTNLAFGTPMEKGYLAIKKISYKMLISSPIFFVLVNRISVNNNFQGWFIKSRHLKKQWGMGVAWGR